MLSTNRQSGQALVAATIGLVALIGATGLAIDMGYLRYQKRAEQTAADSAALAGAAEIGYGGDITDAAQEDASLNGFPIPSKNNAKEFLNKKIAVTVNTPPLTGGYKGNLNSVEVLVSADQPTFFINIFGIDHATIVARSVAQFSGTGPRNCMYVLGNGKNLDNNATINTPNCGIISNGNLNNGAGSITAASIGVVATADRNRVNPSPQTHIIPAADPLGYIAAPGSGGTCQNGTFNNPPFTIVGGRRRRNPPLNKTIGPGLYCSINITGDVNLTLTPGLYVVTGSVSFGGTGSVTGNGVTIYNTTGAVNLSNQVQFNLVAQTSGTYSGILFFQNAGDGSTANVNGAAGSKLQGAFYFPGAALNVNGGANSAAYMIFIANSLSLNANVSFNSDYNSLATGSPVKNAVLVE